MVAKTVYRGLDRVHSSIAIQEYRISDITCMLSLILFSSCSLWPPALKVVLPPVLVPWSLAVHHVLPLVCIVLSEVDGL